MRQDGSGQVYSAKIVYIIRRKKIAVFALPEAEEGAEASVVYGRVKAGEVVRGVVYRVRYSGGVAHVSLVVKKASGRGSGKFSQVSGIDIQGGNAVPGFQQGPAHVKPYTFVGAGDKYGRHAVSFLRPSAA